MTRLPVSGGDDGTWGNILNEFLSVEHNSDGTHTVAVNPEALMDFTESGTLVSGVGHTRFLLPFTITIVGVSLAVDTAPQGSSIIVDVNVNGSTIFTTQAARPQIPAGLNATTVEAVPDVTSVLAGSYVAVDIDQVGSGTAGADLTVIIRYRRA